MPSCAICQDDLSTHGVLCKGEQQHKLCNDCSKNFVSSEMANLRLEAFPPTCSFCQSEMSLPSFEHYLDENQRVSFLQTSLAHSLQNNVDEAIAQCPHCTYFETHKQHASFIYCKRPQCGKFSCMHCFKECSQIADAAQGGQEALDQALQLSMESHLVGCAVWQTELGTSCKLFDEALSAGQKCPRCKLGGVKDDACTHMTCANCQTVWCYVCGLDVASDECDKAPDDGSGDSRPEYRHNKEWHSNERRCPMYLTEIHDLDPSWPVEEADALEHLHRQQTLRRLRAAYDRIGPEAYAQLVEAAPRYGSSRNNHTGLPLRIIGRL